MTFAEKIKLARQKLFLSQEGLAKALNVSFATVNRWETGKHEPGLAAKKAFYVFCKDNNLDLEDK